MFETFEISLIQICFGFWHLDFTTLIGLFIEMGRDTKLGSSHRGESLCQRWCDFFWLQRYGNFDFMIWHEGCVPPPIVRRRFFCKSAGWGVILRMCLIHRHLSIVWAGFRHPFLVGAGSFPFGRCFLVFSPAMVFSHAYEVWTCGASAPFHFKKKGGRSFAPARFPSSVYLSFIL